MAGIPAGPNTFFRVSPAGQCYALKRGEIKERLSAEYYRVEFTDFLHELCDHFPNIRPLGAYGEIVCGPFGSSIKSDDYVPGGVPLLRISNITDEGTLDLKDVVFISREKSEKLASTRVSQGDIVVSQRGTLGMAAVVSSEYHTFNMSANLIAVRALSGLLPRFVQIYLTSELGERQLSRLQSGQVHPKITTDDVASILVPNVPNQAELVHQMDTARAERTARLAEADALLAGLDDFLLDFLGINLAIEQPSCVFAINLAELRAQKLLNSDYYHPERIRALRTLSDIAGNMMVTTLADVVRFERSQVPTPQGNYLSLAHVQSNTGELTDSTNTASGTCFTYQVDDVLFARLRPYLNKVYLAETDGSCSTEFHVLRVIDREALLPAYLAAMLRSKIVLAQTKHMMTGNTHPRLTINDVENLSIPIPSPEVQSTVAAEVIRRRQNARRLRFEGEAGWQAAKQWFGERLLEPSAL